MKLEFYQEVEVFPEAGNNEYIGCKGAILGVSEENGIVYGYAVAIHGKGNTVYFDKDDLSPTGLFFKSEDYY
ncbi:Imm31 family immunity protein [Izhakiella australiensis]|nr:Imm31 family immunity protein [Izhakiella australiensis]